MSADTMEVAHALRATLPFAEYDQVLTMSQGLLDLFPMAIYACAADGAIVRFNTRAGELWGRSPKIGDTDERFCGAHRLYLPDGRYLPHAETPMAQTLRTGVPQRDREAIIERPDGSRINVLVNINPLHASDGRLQGAVNCFQEITELRRAQEHQRLLIAELNHRVKNSLAGVQSIAVQTLRTAESLEAFSTTFTARLMALSRTHDLLARNNWEPAPLRDIVAGELAPYGYTGDDRNGRISVNGPDIRLRPNTSVALGMAFHELATNAVKHGALSVGGGCVDVTWSVALEEGQRRVRIVWSERNGPRVEPPQHRTGGLGLRLIERTLAHESAGHVALALEPEGVRCTMDLALDDTRTA